jgi:hypothetical protein
MMLIKITEIKGLRLSTQAASAARGSGQEEPVDGDNASLTPKDSHDQYHEPCRSTGPRDQRSEAAAVADLSRKADNRQKKPGQPGEGMGLGLTDPDVAKVGNIAINDK